jgi:hypothetical protein
MSIRLKLTNIGRNSQATEYIVDRKPKLNELHQLIKRMGWAQTDEIVFWNEAEPVVHYRDGKLSYSKGWLRKIHG